LPVTILCRYFRIQLLLARVAAPNSLDRLYTRHARQTLPQDARSRNCTSMSTMDTAEGVLDPRKGVGATTWERRAKVIVEAAWSWRLARSVVTMFWSNGCRGCELLPPAQALLFFCHRFAMKLRGVRNCERDESRLTRLPCQLCYVTVAPADQDPSCCVSPGSSADLLIRQSGISKARHLRCS
jgi:hypothetical protein